MAAGGARAAGRCSACGKTNFGSDPICPYCWKARAESAEKERDELRAQLAERDATVAVLAKELAAIGGDLECERCHLPKHEIAACVGGDPALDLGPTNPGQAPHCGFRTFMWGKRDLPAAAKAKLARDAALLRMAVIAKRIDANVETVGDQHERFEDTLP